MTAATVKPDMASKAVGAGAYAIILAVLLWIGSSVVDLREGMATVKSEVQWLRSEMDGMKVWLRRLDDSRLKGPPK